VFEQRGTLRAPVAVRQADDGAPSWFGMACAIASVSCTSLLPSRFEMGARWRRR